MKQSLSDRQKINVELAARALNKKNAKALRNHIPEEERAGLKILFNCECADPACTERLPMTLHEYNQLHKTAGHFIVAKGHNEPTVEKLKASNDDMAVVEKYVLS
jgi:hypothetical protein